MEIKLSKEEKVNLAYTECPRCHRPFNVKKRKKSSHHILPKFLNPKTEVTIHLCLECHDELNLCYKVQEVQMKKYKSKSFQEFHDTYLKLKENFNNKNINRGQFGEGLWSNLVSYLQTEAEK